MNILEVIVLGVLLQGAQHRSIHEPKSEGFDSHWVTTGPSVWKRHIGGPVGAADITVMIVNNKVIYKVERLCAASSKKHIVTWTAGDTLGYSEDCAGVLERSTQPSQWEAVVGRLPERAEKILEKHHGRWRT